MPISKINLKKLVTGRPAEWHGTFRAQDFLTSIAFPGPIQMIEGQLAAIEFIEKLQWFPDITRLSNFES